MLEGLKGKIDYLLNICSEIFAKFSYTRNTPTATPNLVSFIALTQPKSCNAKKKGGTYPNILQSAFQKYNPTATPINSNCYGVVYYFFKVDIGMDADNISKYVWDILKSYTIVDDKLVKYRIAGVFDLNKSNFFELDVTNIQENLLVDLITAINSEDHILYVECGDLKNEFYKVNLGSYAS